MTPKVKDGYCHVWHQYTVRINHGRDRDAAVEQLSAAGIGTGIYYPIPAHHQPHIKAVVGEVSLPVAEQMAKEVISLPVHPQLTQEELNTIVTEVNKL
jgi:dTDP-4-amino-4,6-dideoxygalactose transaminase